MKDKLIVIESSIPPGTTRKRVLPIFSKGRHKLHKDFWVVYIPERLAPGQAIEEIAKTARIIGICDSAGGQMAAALYKNVIKNEILTTDVNVAETSKLVENTYRDVNIAFANETAVICEKLGIDMMEVVRVANTHPRVHVHTPGVGVGGPCIPKDPHLLISPFADGAKKFRVISSAREVNASMPHHFVERIEETFLKMNRRLKDLTFLCWGVTYKANVSDMRDSPAEPVIRSLLQKSSQVYAYDPFSQQTFGARRAKNALENLKMADGLVILTDHDEFKKQDWKNLKKQMKSEVVIFDGRRMLSPTVIQSLKIRYVGVGYGN